MGEFEGKPLGSACPSTMLSSPNGHIGHVGLSSRKPISSRRGDRPGARDKAIANQRVCNHATREEIMLRIVAPAIALAFGAALAQPAAAQSSVDLVKQAVAA